MPYAPGEHFDASMIFRGIMGGGEALAGGISDMLKKQKEAEAQAAGAMIQFQTLKQAKLLSPEEETEFHNGNANKKAAIVTSATPRLAQLFRTQQEQRQAQEHAMNRALQLQIAQMHYGSKGEDSWEDLNRSVHAASGAGLGEWQNAENKREENGFVVADITTPDVFGKEVKKTIRLPKSSFKQFKNRYNTLAGVADAAPSPQSSPSAPQAASGAAPVTPPTVSVIEKNGHHYEVDHASKKVLRQID